MSLGCADMLSLMLLSTVVVPSLEQQEISLEQQEIYASTSNGRPSRSVAPQLSVESASARRIGHSLASGSSGPWDPGQSIRPCPRRRRGRRGWRPGPSGRPCLLWARHRGPTLDASADTAPRGVRRHQGFGNMPKRHVMGGELVNMPENFTAVGSLQTSVWPLKP